MRSRAYSDKRDYNKAVADCTEAMRLDPKFTPNCASVYAIRGLAYDDKHIFDAIYDLSEAIRLNPREANFYLARSILYKRDGQPDKAKKDQERYEMLRGL